jgi:hypothetical protein
LGTLRDADRAAEREADAARVASFAALAAARGLDAGEGFLAVLAGAELFEVRGVAFFLFMISSSS